MVVGEVVSTVLNLAVPGAGTAVNVLMQIFKLCGQIKEGQAACKRVHQRLADILTELTKLETSQRLPPSEALARYGETLRKFVAFLTRYTNQSVVSRALGYQSMMKEVRLVNEEIDALIAVLNLVATNAMMEWKQQWEEEHAGQAIVLSGIAENSETVLSDLNTVLEQQEAIFVLLKTLQRPNLPPETSVPAKRMLDTIVSMSGGSIPPLPKWYIPRNELEYETKPFARGSSGALHRGTWGSGTRIVVKTLLMDGVSNKGGVHPQFLQEVEVWYSLSHPHVVKMFGASHVTSPPFIVCEDATNGNLADYLRVHGRNQMWRLLYQAALGLEYLHRNRVVHGDLKLNNLLVGADGAARVADFGLSFVRRASVFATEVDMSTVLAEAATAENESGGGLRWRAPECITGRPTFESDIYSLAMCVIQAVSGEMPYGYADDASVISQIREGILPSRPAACPDEAWELVVSMTARDRHQRRPLQEVIAGLKQLMETHDTAPTTSSSPLARPSEAYGEHSSVVELIDALKSDSLATQYTALKWLFRKADDETNAHAIKRADGYRWIISCARGPKVTWDHLGYANGILLRMYQSMAITPNELEGFVTREVPKETLEAFNKNLLTGDEESAVEVLEKVRFVLEWPKDGDLALSSIIVDLMRRASVRQLEEATRTLRRLMSKDVARNVIKQGVLPLLFNQFDIGTETQKQQTALTLGHIATYDSQAATSSLIEYLILMIRSGDERLKMAAANTIQAIAQNPATRGLLTELRVYEPLVELLRTGTDVQKGASASSLMRCAEIQEHCQPIVDLGAIPLLLEVLAAKSNTVVTKVYAVCALSQLSRESETRSRAVLDAGGGRILVELLRTTHDGLKQVTLVLLDRLACSRWHQQAIVDAGAIAPVLECLRSGDYELTMTAIDALSALECDDRVLPVLLEIVETGTDTQKDAAAEAVVSLADEAQVCREVVDKGDLKSFIDLVRSATSTDAQRTHSVALLRRVVDADQSDADAVAKEGGVAALAALVHSGSPSQKKDAAYVLYAVARHSAANRAELATLKVVSPLVEMARGEEDEPKTDAAYALGSLMKAASLRREVRKLGGLDALKTLAKSGSAPQAEAARRAVRIGSNDCRIT